MRIVKLGVISAVIFFIILYFMSLLIPSTVRTSRAINIEAPADSIFPLISDSTRWREWNEMDTRNIHINVMSAQKDSLVSEWKYKERTIRSSFRLFESPKVTVVQWYFDFHLKWYPWEKFGSITFEKQFGIPMERSLNNLKKLIEKSP